MKQINWLRPPVWVLALLTLGMVVMLSATLAVRTGEVAAAVFFGLVVWPFGTAVFFVCNRIASRGAGERYRR